MLYFYSYSGRLRVLVNRSNPMKIIPEKLQSPPPAIWNTINYILNLSTVDVFQLFSITFIDVFSNTSRASVPTLSIARWRAQSWRHCSCIVREGGGDRRRSCAKFQMYGRAGSYLWFCKKSTRQKYYVPNLSDGLNCVLF